MTVPTQPHQHSFLQANLVPPDPVTIRCKKCGVPLPDSTWKNCDRCRRNRTESYNRWKRSAQARQSVLNNDSGSTPLPVPISTIQFPSAPTSNPNPPSASHVATAPNPGPSTFSQAPSLSAPPQHYPSGHDHSRLPTGSSQSTSDQPRTAPTLVAPRTIHVPEFQWADELIDQVLALPPRSRFVGKFSVIADPEVDNVRRAQMFADQLRARGIPISQNLKATSRNSSGNQYALVNFCTCQEACHGQVVVSVDDDVSHPDVLGQRIGVAVFHPSG